MCPALAGGFFTTSTAWEAQTRRGLTWADTDPLSQLVGSFLNLLHCYHFVDIFSPSLFSDYASIFTVSEQEKEIVTGVYIARQEGFSWAHKHAHSLPPLAASSLRLCSVSHHEVLRWEDRGQSPVSCFPLWNLSPLEPRGNAYIVTLNFFIVSK